MNKRLTKKERITPESLFSVAVTKLRNPTPAIIADLKICCDVFVKVAIYSDVTGRELEELAALTSEVETIQHEIGGALVYSGASFQNEETGLGKCAGALFGAAAAVLMAHIAHSRRHWATNAAQTRSDLEAREST